MERMRCWNWLLNMSESQIRSKTKLVKPMERLQLSVTAHGWTWRRCHCLPSLCSPSCWQELFYNSLYSLLLQESHGHLRLFLCEGIYAWGAKSETCWVSSVFHSIPQPTVFPEALAEPEGTKNYVWHFPSSLPFPFSSQILVLLHRQVWVYKRLHTHLCNSLWLMSIVPPLLVFIPELLSSVYVSFLVFVSLETPSWVT